MPFYHLLESPGGSSEGIQVPDRPVPMLSYIDIRKLPFGDDYGDLRAGIWGDNRLPETVCMWVNRMHGKTQVVVAYPSTELARASVHRYVETMRAEHPAVRRAALSLDPAFVALAATADGRAALAREIFAALPDPYFEGPRENLQSWFHLDDVPADVVETDAVTAKSVMPRIFGTAMVPGVVAEHAVVIDVPVLLGFGVVDVPPARAPRWLCTAAARTSPPSCWRAARTVITWRPAGTGCGGDCWPGRTSSSMGAGQIQRDDPDDDQCDPDDLCHRNRGIQKQHRD